MMLVAFLVNVTAYPASNGLLPYVAQRVYHVDATGLGWLVASFALGGLAASVATVLTGGPRHPARATLIATGAWYVVLLGFGHVGSIGPGVATLLLAGFAQNVAMIALAATLLGAAGASYRGRVMGVRMLAVYGLPVGLLGVRRAHRAPRLPADDHGRRGCSDWSSPCSSGFGGAPSIWQRG